MKTKRISKVTIKRMIDEAPDTSWLGEYSNRPDSDYSIDRAHSRDCHGIEANHRNAVDHLERAIDYLNIERAAAGNDPENIIYWDSLDEAIDALIQAQEDVAKCDCGFSGHWDNREYRYFNPSRNYDGDTPENIRKYVEQDYARMESLNAGDWFFIGIRAEAEYSVGESRGGYLVQEITSGGLWGVESDSDDDYFAEVEAEELTELRSQLSAIGFSKRAISRAIKNATRENE